MAVSLVGRGGRLPPGQARMRLGTQWKPPKPAATKKPYNWAGAANVNWFPGLNQPAPGGGFQPKPGVDLSGIRDWLTGGQQQNPYFPTTQDNTGGGGGGGNPYANLIGGDYGVAEAESMMNARLGRARGDFQSQIRQALVDLGVTDKSKLGSLGQYIDAGTISKAAENKYSRMAQISQQEAQQQAQNEAALAARGMLYSGQTAKTSQDIISGAEGNRYSALRDYLSGGAQGLTSIADLQDELAGQLAQARADAAARAADVYGYMPGAEDMYSADMGYGALPPTAAANDPYGAGAVNQWLSQIASQPGFSTAMSRIQANPLGPSMLSKRAFLAKKPRGNYQAYTRAYQRQRKRG